MTKKKAQPEEEKEATGHRREQLLVMRLKLHQRPRPVREP